jgi:hypothetical protein
MKHRVLNCIIFDATPWYTVAKELHVCKENQRLYLKYHGNDTLGIIEIMKHA